MRLALIAGKGDKQNGTGASKVRWIDGAISAAAKRNQAVVAYPSALRDCYNERLFDRAGIRRLFHLARFDWAEQAIRERSGSELKVIELGCYDGRLLQRIRPHVAEYIGVDANWSGGLDRARTRFARCRGVRFVETSDASSMRRFSNGQFNIAISLETLEHVPPAQVPEFLDELARVTAGDLFISVPNEIGLVFLAKYVLKRLRYGGADPYSAREIVAAVLGRSEQIARHDHKGFNYKKLVKLVGERFDILSVNGLPRLGLPAWLSFTIAIHARSRARGQRMLPSPSANDRLQTGTP